MSQLTVFLARLIGLFSILFVVAIMVRGGAIIQETAANGAVMLVYALISLALGLAMILGHNVWSGGALPVVVTLVGWLTLAKGLALLCLAPETFSRFYTQTLYGEYYYVSLAPAFLFGLYLTWAGFTAPMLRRPRVSN